MFLIFVQKFSFEETLPCTSLGSVLAVQYLFGVMVGVWLRQHQVTKTTYPSVETSATAAVKSLINNNTPTKSTSEKVI